MRRAVGWNNPSDVTLGTMLQIFGMKTGVLCNAREHAWANFLAVMKCEDKVRPANSR